MPKEKNVFFNLERNYKTKTTALHLPATKPEKKKFTHAKVRV